MEKRLKLIALALCAALLFGLSALALDVPEAELISAPISIDDGERIPPVTFYAADVKELLIEDGKPVAILAADRGTGEELRFNITDATVAVDNESGAPSDLSALKEGDRICVYASAAMTKSLPPQTAAFVVLTGMGEKAPAIYITAGRVRPNDDGNVVILDREGAYLLTLQKDMAIEGYRQTTAQALSPADIRPGSELLFWSEIMTMSYPAMTGADKVVLLPDSCDKDVVSASVEDGTVSVNGEVLALAEGDGVYEKDGAVMLPLRTVAEALGFAVSWDAEARSASVVKDGVYDAFTIGEGTPAPELVNGKTHVPAALLAGIVRIS